MDLCFKSIEQVNDKIGGSSVSDPACLLFESLCTESFDSNSEFKSSEFKSAIIGQQKQSEQVGKVAPVRMCRRIFCDLGKVFLRFFRKSAYPCVVKSVFLPLFFSCRPSDPPVRRLCRGRSFFIQKVEVACKHLPTAEGKGTLGKRFLAHVGKDLGCQGGEALLLKKGDRRPRPLIR